MNLAARDVNVDLRYPRLRSLADALRAERQKPGNTPPTETDLEITPAHLLDDARHNLAHALHHAKRLDDDDIDVSSGASWHNAHTVHHLTCGLDSVQRAIEHLSENPSDPGVFGPELEKLEDDKENVDTDDDSDS